MPVLSVAWLDVAALYAQDLAAPVISTADGQPDNHYLLSCNPLPGRFCTHDGQRVDEARPFPCSHAFHPLP